MHPSMRRLSQGCQSTTVAHLSWQTWPWLFVAAAPSEVAAIFSLVTSTPQSSLSCARCMSYCCFSPLHSTSKHREQSQACTQSSFSFDRLCGITFMSAGRPRRIKFPRQSIKKASLAECNFYPAGSSVCCRVQTRSQPEVSWDLGDIVNKCFACDYYLFIPQAKPTDSYAYSQQGGGYYLEKIWQHFLWPKSNWSAEAVAWKLITSELLLVALFEQMWPTCRVTQQFSVWTIQMCENSVISSASCTQ